MITDCHTHFGIPWVDRDGDNPENWLKIPEMYGVKNSIYMGTTISTVKISAS